MILITIKKKKTQMHRNNAYYQKRKTKMHRFTIAPWWIYFNLIIKYRIKGCGLTAKNKYPSKFK